MSGSLPQLQTFQLPDVGGVVNALQGLELNRMRSQQLQGAEQERNALRAVFADPNFNPSSPDAAARILRAAPNTGAQVFNALTAGQREQRQAQTALTESELKHIELGQALLRPVRDLPEAERPRAYATWLAGMERRIPGFSASAPREYSDAGYYTLLAKASEIVAGNRPRTPVVTQVPGMPPFLTDPITGITRPAAEAGAPPPAAPSVATPPGQTAAAAPRSQSTEPLLIDAAIRRNEGTGRNPASSAVGPYQFVDSTFVDQFRRNFPDIARNLPPEQILTFRGGQLPDGRRVEDVMGPALTRQNQESLTRAGFAPSAGNTYLAHFLGAGGAQAVLRADPNTPISQLVSPEAIRANPSILGVPGVTAGQIVQWANNTIDVGPRDARQRLSSGNAMAPNAAPANAMLAPPDATVVPRPLSPVEFPGAPRPASLSDADLLRRIRDVQQKEAEALMLADVQRQTAAARIAEEADKARGIAQAQAEVRGSLPPPPAGQRYNAEGRLEDIPGSERERAAAERRVAELAKASDVTRDIDRILDLLDTSVSPVTGFMAPTLSALLSGSPATNVKRLRDTIESNISLSTLQQLRAQSPTGAALGQVTNQDMDTLKASLSSLSQDQSPQQFRQNLLNIRNKYMEIIFGPRYTELAPPAREPPAPTRLPGRRGAPPTSAARPTLEQFLERARPANPNASVEDLTSYYNRTYGGR